MVAGSLVVQEMVAPFVVMVEAVMEVSEGAVVSEAEIGSEQDAFVPCGLVEPRQDQR